MVHHLIEIIVQDSEIDTELIYTQLTAKNACFWTKSKINSTPFSRQQSLSCQSKINHLNDVIIWQEKYKPTGKKNILN